MDRSLAPVVKSSPEQQIRTPSRAKQILNKIRFWEKKPEPPLPHQSGLDDLDSTINHPSNLPVTPHPGALTQFTGKPNLLEPLTLRMPNRNSYNSTVQGSSNPYPNNPALFTDKSSEPLMGHPLKLNPPDVIVDRPVHLAWLDDPHIFADMLQDRNRGNETLNNLDHSDNKAPETKALNPGLASSPEPEGVDDAVMFGAFPKDTQAMLATSYRLQKALEIDNLNTRWKLPQASDREIGIDSTQKNALSDVLTTSHELQSQPEIHDPDASPHSDIPLIRQTGSDLIQKNANKLRSALDVCSKYAVTANRKSEHKQFVDAKVLALHMKDNKEASNSQHKVLISENSRNREQVCGFEGITNTAVTDPELKEKSRGARQVGKEVSGSHRDLFQVTRFGAKMGNEAIQDEESVAKDGTSTTKPAIFRTKKSSLAQTQVQVPSTYDTKSVVGGQEKVLLSNLTTIGIPGKRIMGARKTAYASGDTIKYSDKPESVRRTIAVPEPSMMPSTFTNVICQQDEFLVAPVLTLSLSDRLPLTLNPGLGQSELLLHLEVGLDGVEAICRGEVKIKTSAYGKENVYEKPFRTPGVANSRDGKADERWIFFGVRFQQTDEERANAKCGKWACWGFPKLACSQFNKTRETISCGGVTDSQGTEIPEYKINIRRTELLSSFGGMAAMDLWEGALDWKDEVWGKIVHSMDCNSLETSFLFADSTTYEVPRRRRKNEPYNRNAKRAKGNPRA